MKHKVINRLFLYFGKARARAKRGPRLAGKLATAFNKGKSRPDAPKVSHGASMCIGRSAWAGPTNFFIARRIVYRCQRCSCPHNQKPYVLMQRGVHLCSVTCNAYTRALVTEEEEGALTSSSGSCSGVDTAAGHAGSCCSHAGWVGWRRPSYVAVDPVNFPYAGGMARNCASAGPRVPLGAGLCALASASRTQTQGSVSALLSCTSLTAEETASSFLAAAAAHRWSELCYI
jgi:hypothetical protein